MSATPTSSTDSAEASNTSTAHGFQALSPATSLPFTFVIVFVAVFLFFVGCSCGSRRFAWELRHRIAVQDQDTPRRVRQSRPVLWDVWTQMGRNTRKNWVGQKQIEEAVLDIWSAVQPLSVTYVREHQRPKHRNADADCARPPVSAALPVPRPPAPLTLPSAFLRVFERILFLPPFIPPRIPPRRDETEFPEVPKAPPPVRALQVSILIAMPSPVRGTRRIPRSMDDLPEQKEDRIVDEERRGRTTDEVTNGDAADGEKLGEYVIGMTEVPWTDDGS
ncbi:hypothetical protein SCP_0509990 [Sparassis crispa]|uniref:Transmembrane protein n=1 Tax=Sparassis crispa TaxID=139825 RepID=A0A401GP48_9APHY|nr:hypothetical protein SCP_0509990 [Sparassis crispa]GBE83940.1 hypothetical protein SCP_0509990 [Sparassis crispa]